MTVWGAFLRGINLGKRRMAMADLRACLEEAGFTEVKTNLASGNVRFAAEGTESTIKADLERLVAARFGFSIGVVLRSQDQLRTMLAGHPFATLDPRADVTRHVLLLDAALPADLKLEDRPGDTEIVRIDRREIYLAAYRQPNGRYTEHLEQVLAPLYGRLGKQALGTMRNWNTIEKILP